MNYFSGTSLQTKNKTSAHSCFLSWQILQLALIGSPSVLFTLPAAAQAPTSGAYATDATNIHVFDATSESLKTPNTVLCYMNGTGATKTALLNQGAYPLLVDSNKCDSSGGGDSASSDSSGSSAPNYAVGVASSSRVDNNSDLIGKLWMSQSQNGGTQHVFAKVTASQAPSASSLYGKFHTDYCGVSSESASDCSSFLMRGFADGDGGNITSYHRQIMTGYSEETSVYLSGTTSTGAGRAKRSVTQGGSTMTGDWKFAFDTLYFKRANNDGTNEQCFDRNATNADRTTWRYGVYTSDGARLERNGGFPIKTADGKFGYVGYYGANIQGGGSLADGDVVTRFSFSGGQSSSTSYTVVKTSGRMKKLVKKTTTLEKITNVPFFVNVMNTFTDSGSGSRTQGTMLETKWDGTNFVITGSSSGGGMPTPDSNGFYIPASVFQNPALWPSPVIMAYSQSLGGNIKIPLKDSSGNFASPTNATAVIYRTESILQPGGTGWPQGNLFCAQNCPDATNFSTKITTGANIFATDGTSPFAKITNTLTNSDIPSAFNGQKIKKSDAHKYSANSTTGILYGLTSGAEDQTKPITWTSGNAASMMIRGGFQTGLMVDSGDSTAMSQFSCTSVTTGDSVCPYKLDNVDTVYQWETGTNPWNSLTALKDSNNTPLAFDPPLRLSYNVPSNATGGQSTYAGATLNLQYNGFGELFGIPSFCVNPANNQRSTTCSNTDRWVSAFSLALGDQLSDGTNTYYVRPLEQELRLARLTGGQCSALTLPTITDAQLPGISGWTDPVAANGAKPSVSGATRVIDGDVKY